MWGIIFYVLTLDQEKPVGKYTATVQVVRYAADLPNNFAATRNTF